MFMLLTHLPRAVSFNFYPLLFMKGNIASEEEKTRKKMSKKRRNKKPGSKY